MICEITCGSVSLKDEALVQWPPIGREKITYKGKKRGKNELIAGSIVEQTGSEYLRDPRKEGPRKKISSHIQQLRKYFLHDTKGYLTCICHDLF